MALSPEAQRILAEFRQYADNERLERGVNDEKIAEVMKREEERAKNTLFDNAKTIRAERNFAETFGYSEYERQLGRTGRTSADERERAAQVDYQERLPRQLEGAVNDFIRERAEVVNVRELEAQQEVEFFEAQAEFTQEQKLTLDAFVERIYSDMDDTIITPDRREDLQAAVEETKAALDAAKAAYEEAYREAFSGPEKSYWEARAKARAKARRPPRRGQPATPVTESDRRRAFELNTKSKPWRTAIQQAQWRYNVAVGNATRFDNSAEPLATLRAELNQLAAKENVTPNQVLRIDQLIKEANAAIDHTISISGQHYKEEIQATIQAMEDAISAKERQIFVSANIGGQRAGSVFEPEGEIIIPEIPQQIGDTIGAGLEGVFSNLANALNPSPAQLEEMYLENLKAQMRAAEKFQAERGKLQNNEGLQGRMMTQE